MGKLRMKETASERRDKDKDDGDRSKRRKKRHKDKEGDDIRSSKYYKESDDNHEDSDAYVPPRPSKDRPYVPYSFDDGDEESQVPSATANANKRDKATEDEMFNQKLFDAMRDDEGGVDPYSKTASHSGISFDYREDMETARYGVNGVANDRFVDPATGAILNRIVFMDAMTEDEYAEHIRQGMFRRTRREEIARQELLARERAEKARKRQEAIERTKALEAERLRKLEERAKRKAQAGSDKQREIYQARWARLLDPKTATEPLRSHDFPWPFYESPSSSSQGQANRAGEMDKQTIKSFLTSHLDDNAIEDSQLDKKVKQAIRTAVLAYHPDRFERYVLRVKDDKERESVRSMGLRISQTLNELLQDV